MGFMDKFKDFMGIPDDEQDYEDTEVEYEYEQEPEEADSREEPSNIRSERDRQPLWKDMAARREQKESKVVTIPTTTQLQVVIVKPESFDEGSAIGDHLNAKRTVLLNLENTNKDTARRLVDFLSGVAYANGGQIKKVANATFIITPNNVPVLGESILDDLESSGLKF